MIGIYPLSSYPTTFDFAPWCVIAKSRGATHVRFVTEGRIDTRKYSEDIAWRRFANILVPMCKLAGLRYSVGDDVKGRVFPYLYGDVEKTYRELGSIEKLQTAYHRPDTGYVTITIRESFRNRYRDSNISAWEKVRATLEARGKRVVWLNDCERLPMYLEDRMALYAGADMNLGVANGPMALCHFSEAPYITVNMAPVRPEGEESYDVVKLLVQQGFAPGSQFSFRNERQLMVWEPDSYETIMDAYECLERGSRERAVA